MRSDVTKTDVLVAVVTTLTIETAGLVAFGRAYEREPVAPRVDPGYAVPVNLVPVVDVESHRLKPGGGGSLVPESWQRHAQRAVARSGRRTKHENGVQRRRDGETVGFERAWDAAPKASGALRVDAHDAGRFRGDAGEWSGTPGAPAGEGHPEGVDGGTETDPLRARALELYRSRLKRWFGARFRVKGSGLSPEDLRRYRVDAVVRVDEHRRVSGHSITASGNAQFDAAARAALESVDGLELPPPPAAYPGAIQRAIHVTFVCREDACD